MTYITVSDTHYFILCCFLRKSSVLEISTNSQVQHLIETLISSCANAVVVIDDSGEIQTWNEAASNLFAVDQEFSGRKLEEFIQPFPWQHIPSQNGDQTPLNRKSQVEISDTKGKKIRGEITMSEIKAEGHSRFVCMFHSNAEIDEIRREFLEEREMFDAVVTAAVDGIILINASGIIQKVNPAVCKLFRYTKDQILGKNIRLLMPSPDANKHDGYISNYLKTGSKKIIGIGREVFGKKSDGSVFPFRLSVSEVVLNEQIFFAGIIHDLTEQKKAQKKLENYAKELEIHVQNRTREIASINEGLRKQIIEKSKAELALKESQRLYKAIATNFPDGTIIVLDKDFRYIFAEGLELNKKGKDEEKLKGTSYLDQIEEAERPKITDMFLKVLNGAKQRTEIRINNDDYTLNAVPLAGDKEEIHRILLVEKNITSQKQAEKDIQNALEKERELNILKSRFVSMASHEFRTPLSTVLSSVGLAEKYVEIGDAQKQRKHFERIKNSVHTLTNILNDFLSLDKLETGRIQTAVESFDLTALVSDVSDEMTDLLKESQEISINSNGPVILESDPKLVKNVMLNLLSNASKYSGEQDKIEIDVAKQAKEVKVSIRDHGIGISKEDQESLFERFFRSNNVSHIQGTGLGLNIVKRYIHLLNGRIEFTSEPGQGSVFTFYVPIKTDIKSG
jgi:PAS domain S-box-containing protein